jgi:hypothetical protein
MMSDENDAGGHGIPYGLDRDKRAVHISEVDPGAGRGLSCGLFCPGCSARLMAKMGLKRKAHFAHESGAECAGARMSALHAGAQRELMEACSKRMALFVPKMTFSLGGAKRVVKGRAVGLISGATERPIPGCSRIADAKVKTAASIMMPELFVEILATHAVDEAKARDILASGMPCIEIDLSGMIGTDFGPSELREAVLNGAPRQWIAVPLAIESGAREELEAKAKKRKEELAQRKKLMEEERAKAAEEAARTKQIAEAKRAEFNEMLKRQAAQALAERIRREEEALRLRASWRGSSGFSLTQTLAGVEVRLASYKPEECQAIDRKLAPLGAEWMTRDVSGKLDMYYFLSGASAGDVRAALSKC